MYYMRTEVYSWRLSRELKSDLEREARSRQVSVSAVLDSAVREWLKKSTPSSDEEEEQRRLHAAAASCLGTLASDNPRRAETARSTIRQRLNRSNAP